MLDVPPQDGRSYFMLPQTPEEAGYYVYGTPGHGRGQFAHPVLLSLLFWVEHQWQAIDGRPFGIGNISLANGPYFYPHKKHQDGMQVDLRALRLDGKRAPVKWQDSGYDRPATAHLTSLFLSHPAVAKIYFNDPGIHGVFPLEKHDDHFHVDVRVSAP